MPRFRKIYDVIIAGAGPAGSSAAIHLANHDVSVLLVEQKQFPRAKLCGEFISPECLDHFRRLGVAGDMMQSNPAVLTETVFYSHTGRKLTVPSRWFGGTGALGLSRAVMDNNLLQRARVSGVTVLEGTSVTGLLTDNDRVRGVRLKSEGIERNYEALITVDATGRVRALTRKVKVLKYRAPQRSRPRLVAFKVHLENTKVADGACEIYSYPGGYGGLSTIEGGIGNLCFIASSADVQRCHSNPDMVLRETLLRNPRAAHVMETATYCSEWLSVSLERFGKQQTVPARGLLAIGDSAAFIDPFTGSGMLMALESGELVSQVITSHLKSLDREFSSAAVAMQYSAEYQKRFDSRFRVSGLLRCAAFMPGVAEFAIALCGASEWLRNRLVRATRARGRKESRPSGAG